MAVTRVAFPSRLRGFPVWLMLVSCRPSSPPVAADSVAVYALVPPTPDTDSELRHLDSVIRQYEESLEALNRSRGIGSAVVQLEGPVLIAVYPP